MITNPNQNRSHYNNPLKLPTQPFNEKMDDNPEDNQFIDVNTNFKPCDPVYIDLIEPTSTFD